MRQVRNLQQAQSAQAINSRDHEKGEQEEATLAERPVSLEQIIATLSPGVTDPTPTKTPDAPIQQPDQDAQTSELIADIAKAEVPPASETYPLGTSQLEADSGIEAEPVAGSDPSEPEVSTAIVPVRAIQAEMGRDLQEIQLSTWTSASRAREWWEALKEHKPDRNWLTAQWNRHRGSVWVGISLLTENDRRKPSPQTSRDTQSDPFRKIAGKSWVGGASARANLPGESCHSSMD